MEQLIEVLTNIAGSLERIASSMHKIETLQSDALTISQKAQSEAPARMRDMMGMINNLNIPKRG
jgi:hypothetical protein